MWPSSSCLPEKVSPCCWWWGTLFILGLGLHSLSGVSGLNFWATVLLARVFIKICILTCYWMWWNCKWPSPWQLDVKAAKPEEGSFSPLLGRPTYLPLSLSLSLSTYLSIHPLIHPSMHPAFSWDTKLESPELSVLEHKCWTYRWSGPRVRLAREIIKGK